ncbi:hypothetical protein FRB97_000434, partial [Tulasnella sp. 331]
MLVATVMHAILDAFFFDLDLDLILFILCNIIAFIMFGIITLGLAYGFHPELTTYYVTSFVYGSPAPEFVSTVPTPPVVPELAHHSPVLLPHPIQPKRTQTAISEVNRDRFHQPGNRRFVSNLANDPLYTPLRQEPHSLRTTPTPLYPSAAPAPLAMALRHRGPATERFIRQDRINSIAPSLPTPPHAHPINSKPPSPATSPSPAKETGTPHHRPTLTELRESVLASLSLTKTLPLAVDENGAYLPYKLARKSDYWTVVEKETGAVIGIINATGHLGQGISTLGSVHAQATSIGLPIDPIFNTLQAYTFESLPRNPDGSHTKITPSSHAKYLNVYDLDGTHRSVIDQDSRLFKVPYLPFVAGSGIFHSMLTVYVRFQALELFASGDFTTSVEHLAPIQAAITPAENGLLSTVTAHTTTPPAPVTADTGMLGAAPIAAATIADTLPAFVAPIFADTIMTEILTLTDIDMAEAPPITAGTEMLYADMDTSASGPLILIDTLMTVSNASGLADPDMAVPAAPSSGDTMMVEVANSPALGAFDMMDVASDSLDDIAMAEATAIDAAAIILEVDVHIDYDDAVMTDTTTDPILPEIDMAD